MVDGAKVQSPNTPIIKEEVELNADNVQPEQGKSMVATFTMVPSVVLAACYQRWLFTGCFLFPDLL